MAVQIEVVSMGVQETSNHGLTTPLICIVVVHPLGCSCMQFVARDTWSGDD